MSRAAPLFHMWEQGRHAASGRRTLPGIPCPPPALPSISHPHAQSAGWRNVLRRLEERAPPAGGTCSADWRSVLRRLEERAPSRGEVLEVSSAAKDVEREALRIRHASRLQRLPLLPQREQDICSKKHHYHHSAIGRFGFKPESVNRLLCAKRDFFVTSVSPLLGYNGPPLRPQSNKTSAQK